MNQAVEMIDEAYKQVPFAFMVGKLFKAMENQTMEFLHATVGISTEVAELVGATTRKNVIEEAGDLEFYIQALVNMLELELDSDMLLSDDVLEYTRETTYDAHIRNLSIIGGDLLDIAKKAWIYNRELDVAQSVTSLVGAMYFNLQRVYMLIGTTTDDVIMLNKEKLIGPEGRFKGMEYSDAAANARADKKPGDDRRFIGQKAA